MFPVAGLQQTTSYKVVLPFYFYAAVSFLLACIFLFTHSDAGQDHYFSPIVLSITHIMALGWGTMIILGASHQLLPVLIEGRLYSTVLGYISFVFTALGIPMLAYGFYEFNFGHLTQCGALLINTGVLSFFINVLVSVFRNHKANMHAWFMSTATVWLLTTTVFGMLLVFNFTYAFLPSESVKYLSLHAHLGILGWFLMMVLGVGSRLIPMFLISKYQSKKTLQWIYGLVNFSLLAFIAIKLMDFGSVTLLLPIVSALVGIFLFGNYCYQAYKVRIRKNVDLQMKTSLISVVQMFIPIVVISFVIALSNSENQGKLGMLYGFCIFFGWITAIIFGMTFKTLPFIVWNRSYHKKAHAGKTPAPKELFNDSIFYIMLIAYLVGFIIFIFGIVTGHDMVLKSGAALLVLSALLYVMNVMIVFLHKPKQI
ncbi:MULTISPECIES: cytochrome C oxidase subunit I [Amniculibacterium]|uniref:cytochrome C oxidase subunit I n=1 Tax=Amniculibacterium TaxID=2715289 RepID=UPI000F5A0033|nr:MULTISPECIES: cytochrome C oxidase subunit I [Amniculibacterium]